MVRRAFVLGIACLSLAVWLTAHTVVTTKITWSRDVSRLVYQHCASCHHIGGTAFSLMTYKEARPWAEDIKQQVLERRMPPWNAVKGFGEFKDDAGLTQEDLEIMGEWVDGGAPEGNPFYLPPTPEFTTPADPAPDHGRRLAVLGTKVMKHSVEAVGIEPRVVPAGVLQVVAHLPDGEIEPLIWVERFSPDLKRTYYFRKPLRFPPGARIEVVPKNGSATLVIR